MHTDLQNISWSNLIYTLHAASVNILNMSGENSKGSSSKMWYSQKYSTSKDVL